MSGDNNHAGQDYAGDVDPAECWQTLTSDPMARLVDVRTQPEWTFVGQVDASDARAPAIGLSWQVYPHMQIDASFVDTLKRMLAETGAAADDPVYFLCRSGVRSLHAARAMTAAGLSRCYNIAGGFEGDADGEGHRGRVNGWKKAGLPWRQS